MPQPARLAIGSVQPSANRFPILWGLLDLLRRHGVQVQPFRSHAELASSPGAEVATGRPYRHLDCGMMFPRLCGHLLQHGSRGCDVAVVDGLFAPRREEGEANPFYLDALCNWLDLAGVVVVDVSQLQCGHLPERPGQADAVILDCVGSPREAARWQTEVELIWRTPVVGWMEHAAPLRAVAEGLPADARPSPKLCRALGDALAHHLDEDLLLALAHRQRIFTSGDPLFHIGNQRGSRVAVGIDEAMSRHFPENLDLISARGATVVDFSPLRSAELPRDVGVVYLGDGCLQAFARKLASNYCLLVSLRSFVASGGRVYAEGMGAALLGQELIYPDGTRLPMAGVVPWSYRLVTSSEPASLRTLNVERDNWLVHRCGRLRGYVGCTRLEVVDEASAEAPPPEIPSSDSLPSDRAASIRSWAGAVASTLPLFFPAHPRLVTNLLRPAHDLCGTK
jgi:cobyrinic acid a,c-diamide synthase